MPGSTGNKRTKKNRSQVYRPCSIATSNNLNLTLESHTNSFDYRQFDLLLNRTTTMDRDMRARMAMLTSTKTRQLVVKCAATANAAGANIIANTKVRL